MKAIVYKRIDQKLSKEWQALWEKSNHANYVNSPAWFLSVIDIYKYQEFAIIAIYEKEQLVVVAGLVKEKKYGVTVYTVAPGDFVCGIPFLIDLEDKKALRILHNSLNELGTVYLDNVLQEFKELLQVRSIGIARDATINYYLAIKKDENGQVQVRHKKRLLRRSETIENELSLHKFVGCDQAALNTAFAIDNKSNKQANGYNAFYNQQTILFYESLAKSFGEKFVTYLLYHKKKPVAYQIAFFVGKTLYCSQIAFVKAYEQYSIGRSLLIRMIEEVGANGVDIIDFGSGEDHVKRSLTKEHHNLFTVILTSNKKISTYLIIMTQTKNYFYSQLHKRSTIYSLYCKAKNMINANSK